MATSLFGLTAASFKSRIELTWRTPRDDAVFEAFSKIGAVEEISAARETGEAAKDVLIRIGPVLSDLEKPTYVMTVSCLKDGEHLHWLVTEANAPSEPPPPNVISASEKAGNYVGICERLSETLSASQEVGNYRITSILPEAEGWKCALLDRCNVAEELKDLGSIPHNEEIGYRFESGTSGLQEFSVLYDHEDRRFILKIEIRALLNPDRNADVVLGAPAQLTHLVLSRVFKQSEQL